MLKPIWRRLSSAFHRGLTPPRSPYGKRPLANARLEELEARLAPATLHWTGAAADTIGFVPGGLTGEYFVSLNPIGPNLTLNPTNPNSVFQTVPTVTMVTPFIDFPSINFGPPGIQPQGFTLRGQSTPLFAPRGQIPNSNIGALWVGEIYLSHLGAYSFGTANNDGSALWLDATDPRSATPLAGAVGVVNNDAVQGRTLKTGTYTNTSIGLHTIIIGYWSGGGSASMTAYWNPSGGSIADNAPAQVIPSSVFYHITVGSSWSNVGNWAGGVAPTTGDTVVFDSSTANYKPSTASVNDIPNLTLNGIVVNNPAGPTQDPAQIIQGRALTINNTDTSKTSGITANIGANGTRDGPQTTIRFAKITLGSNTVITNTSPTPQTTTATLDIFSNIDLAGHTLTDGTTTDTGLTEISGVISSSIPLTDGVTENGHGVLELTGANTFDTAAQVIKGTLVDAGDQSLGAVGATVGGGGILAVSGGDAGTYSTGVTLQSGAAIVEVDATNPTEAFPIVSSTINPAIIVWPPPTTPVDVSSSAPGAIYGSSVTFTAHVNTGGAILAGTVRFYVDGNPMGIDEQVVNDIAVSPAITQLSAGTHTIEARYSGWDIFPNGDGTYAQVINQAQLTLTAATNTKSYNANTVASALPTVTGLVAPDTISNLAETYDNMRLGTGKTLTVAGGYKINNGFGNNNYAVTLIADHTGAIVPGPFTRFNVSVAGNSVVAGNASLLTVQATDLFGNPVTAFTGPITLTSSDPKATLPPDASLTNGVGTFTVTLNTAGNQTITATDAVSSSPITITGTSAPVAVSGLMVTALTPTPTGFIATFNQAINPADLTLYGKGTTQQDVLLVGQTTNDGQAYPGTLIVDPSGKVVTFNVSAAFLAASNNGTSAALPDDTYTVTLLSGVGNNGFQDLVGQGFDDGSGGHGDFTGTFTTTFQTLDRMTSQGNEMLGIPDFARGPNASGDTTTLVQVPNDPAHGGHVGIPVTFYNAFQLTFSRFTLTYDSQILTITGGISDPTNGGATFQLESNVAQPDGIHSVATFSYSGGAINGTQILGDIIAYVPNSAKAKYQVKDLLVLGNISVNPATIRPTGPGPILPDWIMIYNATVLGGTSVDVNAYMGDVNGDHHIDGVDKALVANVASTLNTGFTAFTLLDPAIIGDVSGDNAVTANSTSLLSNYLLGKPVPKIPALPNPPIADNLFTSPFASDPTLSMPATVLAASGLANLPIYLDHPRPAGSIGLVEAELTLAYDPAVLSVTVADITLGSLPSQGTGWQLSAVVDAATGQISIQLYSQTPIPTDQAGTLVNIAFHQKSDAPSPVTTVQLVESKTVLADAQAAMILTPGLDWTTVLTSNWVPTVI